MKRNSWQVWLAVILVAAMAGAGWYYWKKANKPPSVGKTVTVKRGMIRSLVQATGSVAAVNAVDISAKITGRIVEVRAAENDVVTAGQVVIVLDDSHYRALANQAAAKLDTRRKDFGRLQKLAAVGAIPAKELDDARMKWQVAEADYQIAMTQLDDTVIHAPVGGTVVGKPVPAGQTVSPGLSSPLVLMSVADVSSLELQVQVDEADIGKLKAGQKVGFMVDAFPEKMHAGTIKTISEKANIQQNVVYYPATIMKIFSNGVPPPVDPYAAIPSSRQSPPAAIRLGRLLLTRQLLPHALGPPAPWLFSFHASSHLPGFSHKTHLVAPQ